MQEIPTTSNQREQEILRELRLAGGLSRVSFLQTGLGFRMRLSAETLSPWQLGLLLEKYMEACC